MCNLSHLLTTIDHLKARLDQLRPLNTAQLKNLLDAWDIEYTYESNRIEGNSLTLRETHLVIAKRITLQGKSIEEHLEARNHQEAIIYIRQLAQEKTPLTEHIINSIHNLILGGIDSRHAGKYRTVQVMISGATHKPLAPYLLAEMMQNILIWYQEHASKLHPVLLAANMHQKLVTVHPWMDGNGRTSRLVMNLILLQQGYPIARISGDDAARIAYYEALDASQLHPEQTIFEHLIASYVHAALVEFLDVIDPKYKA